MDSEGEDDIVWFVDNAPADLFSRHKRSLVLRSVNTSLDRLGKRYGEVEDQYTLKVAHARKSGKSVETCNWLFEIFDLF